MTKLFFTTIIAIIILFNSKLMSIDVTTLWKEPWNSTQGYDIHDFEFLKGEDELILIAGTPGNSEIQIRSISNGELLESILIPYLNYNNQLEITPDSSQFILTTGGDADNKASIELRNIEGFELVKKLKVNMDSDSLDIKNKPYYYQFKNIIIDPDKPYIYTLLSKKGTFSSEIFEKTWLKVYNYETMSEVSDLTPSGFEDKQLSKMDISDDGMFLALINDGESYLKIWNLDSSKLIVNRQLFDSNYSDPKEYSCKVGEIEFSSIDDDLIYISGVFPNKLKLQTMGINPLGLHKYRISTDSFNKVYNKFNPFNEFTLFNDEKRVLLGSDGFTILNQENNTQEVFLNYSAPSDYGKKTMYSKKYDFFIRRSWIMIHSFRFDGLTSVETDLENDIVISPNPTKNHVNIELVCNESQVDYQISDLRGNSLLKNTIFNQSKNLQFDFSKYSKGVYFLTINCNNHSRTYKIVKEG